MIADLVCSAVALVLYVNTLGADFCYDDRPGCLQRDIIHTPYIITDDQDECTTRFVLCRDVQADMAPDAAHAGLCIVGQSAAECAEFVLLVYGIQALDYSSCIWTSLLINSASSRRGRPCCSWPDEPDW
ncbi:hypothetical protein Baya_2879 [Bagarius yarrelli]|uniref:Secreted protein n=1 Tax=Bagarius yarrelli TaxID=175774 RepID=A0A556TQV1_BAGYA|nr:hypothetical protein Baya_2879 [Bagarius yarrelli]